MKVGFKARVQAKERISPSLLRICLGGGEVDAFVSTGYPDEWVRLVFPNEAGDIVLPETGGGRHADRDPMTKSPTRPYSVRKWDAARSEMTIDFALHDDGLATNWAVRAEIGDEIGVAHPDGRYRVPEDANWILLLCDLTGLPAASRIIEHEVAGRTIHLHVELPSEADVPQAVFDQAGEANWYPVPPYAIKPTALDDIACSIVLPEGPGYVWIAGEAQAIYKARGHFRDTLGFDKDRITAIGYWFRDRSRS